MSTPQNRYKIDALGRLRRRTHNGQYETIANTAGLSNETRLALLADLRSLACGLPDNRKTAIDIANNYLADARPGPGRPPLPHGDGKTSQLQIRIEPRRKAAYVKAAARSPHKKLAAWATAALDNAAGYEPNIIPNSDEAARIVSIERGAEIATVNLEWGGPNQRTITDFDCGQLGDVVDCGDTPHASGGWVVVSGRCRKKVGSDIPYVPGESD